ncbi:MAG: hypothetical protein M3O70_21305 [Actinomycetota bacterium]|nr:hypothetical protein [Actinomycetota bacterium]
MTSMIEYQRGQQPLHELLATQARRVPQAVRILQPRLTHAIPLASW